MFGLLKLVAYGLLGYAIYEFVRGMSGAAQQAAAGGGGFGGAMGGGGGGPGAMRSNMHDDAGRANITGPGEGTTVASQEGDGGSVQHRVGRGVVAR